MIVTSTWRIRVAPEGGCPQSVGHPLTSSNGDGEDETRRDKFMPTALEAWRLSQPSAMPLTHPQLDPTPKGVVVLKPVCHTLAASSKLEARRAKYMLTALEARRLSQPSTTLLMHPQLDPTPQGRREW